RHARARALRGPGSRAPHLRQGQRRVGGHDPTMRRRVRLGGAHPHAQRGGATLLDRPRMSAVPETIEISPWSPMWPATYDIARERLMRIFGADGARLEHIGATSVEGVGGRPIIDILLGVPDLSTIERHIPDL